MLFVYNVAVKNPFHTHNITSKLMFTRTLGPTSARLLTRLAEKGRTVFSIADAQKVLEHNYDATRQTLGRLVRSGWLVRLTPGHYAIVPLSSGSEATPQANRYVIARELLRKTPYYVSHESAMDIHNMLTRPVTTVTITTPRRLANRTIMRVSYRFVYAPDQAIWGHSPVWVTPYEQVIVSDLEKTILDGLIRPDLCAGVEQVATGLWMRHDESPQGYGCVTTTWTGENWPTMPSDWTATSWRSDWVTCLSCMV
jgi:predicted transcriptional regulator of viral defense system